MSRAAEVLVVGGGVAGPAAAALLAREGRRVVLIEREAEPRHKICGEFLSVEARRHLAALGLDLAPLGGAPISRLRLASGRRMVEAALPFAALGISRLRLDEALLAHAERLGARVERGVAARSLGERAVETSAGPLTAPTVLLASGKHEVRGARRDARGTLNGLVGFKMHFRVGPGVRQALADHIELILFEGGYAGLQLVEGGVANLCLLVEEARFTAIGRSWDALFAALLHEPHLARRLGDAEALFPKALTIAAVPYGFLFRHGPSDPPGLYRLGDQAAVIPSFCGDGMSIALHSARLAARSVLAGEPAALHHARLRRDVGRPVRTATTLQRLGGGRTGQALMLGGLRLAPGLMTALAAGTRVPERALRREGLA